MTTHHGARRTRTSGRIRSDTVSRFHPSPAQRRYLSALEQALASRQSASDTAVCASIGISRMTLWKWRRCREFRAWLQAELDQTGDLRWPLILRRHELLALDGSVKSAEFIWKVRSGRFSRAHETGGAEAHAVTDYSVNILVPRPAVDACPDQ